MKSKDVLLGDVDEAVALYLHQCSVLVTATDLATIAATLAAGGRNPRTGEQVISREIASGVLSVMATCGMYDSSGEWMVSVGLPAKSGVSGGIVAARPGQFGVGVFSPRLDALGNSMRGSSALRRLSKRFGLHMMVHPDRAAPVIHDVSDRETDGVAVEIIAAQGALDFAAAENLLWRLGDLPTRDPRPAWLVLDMHRVTHYFDVAEVLIGAQIERLRRDGIDTVIVHGGDPLPDFSVKQHPSVEQALAGIAAATSP